MYRTHIFPVLLMFPYVVDKNVIWENAKSFIRFLTSISSPFSNELWFCLRMKLSNSQVTFFLDKWIWVLIFSLSSGCKQIFCWAMNFSIFPGKIGQSSLPLCFNSFFSSLMKNSCLFSCLALFLVQELPVQLQTVCNFLIIISVDMLIYQ